MYLNKINVNPHYSECITSSDGNKISQLGNKTTSIKNSMETLFIGNEKKRKQNINKICGELIQRISTKTKNGEYERVEANKLNDGGRISTSLTHKTLANGVTKLFHAIKNELINQKDKSLSILVGHADKSVNIMLATLYQVYQQADKHIQKNINLGNNSLLKSQIPDFVSKEFTIQNDNLMIKNHDIMTVLEDIYKKHQGEIELLKRNASDKINSKL
ncbi:hypothetical protein [Proteus vulgaris]|uniref:hypothetical protein n=1 Tax=Proteus vulgaris TaxID=585 RepID=UPI0034D69F20